MAKVLCMEIGRSLVRVAEVRTSGKNVTVLKTAVFETKEDLTKDGKVRVSEEVITEIREGLEKAEMASTEVYFVVDSTRILYKTVEIPYVTGKQVESTLELSFSDMFPVDESLYHLSYINKGAIKKEEQKMLQLEVWAVPNDLSESYYSLAVSLGLSPKGLADATHSVATLLSDAFRNRNVATISLGEVSSAIAVLVDGNVIFSKSIPIGVENAINVINKSSLTLDDIGNVGALELLYTQNILLNQLPKSIDSQTEEEAVRYDATNALSGLIAAIETNLTQFLQKEGVQIQDVYLTGLGSGIAGISKLFAFEFGAPVTVIQQDTKLTIDKSIADDTLLLACYTAIGATIDKSNMFTKAERAGGDIAKRKQVDRIFAIVGLTCFLLGCAFGVYSILQASMRRDDAKKEVTALQNSIAHLQSLGVEQKYDEYALAASYNEEVKAIYEETKSGNEDMTDFLRELESIFPASAVVSSITISPSTATVTTMCEDKYVAAGVLHLMRNMQSIKSMQCSGVGEDDEGNVIFTVSFTLKSTAERKGLVDENGNPVENPDDNPDITDNPVDNPDDNEKQYVYVTHPINVETDIVLNEFSIDGVDFDASSMSVEQLNTAAFILDEETQPAKSIGFGENTLVDLGNASIYVAGENADIHITVGTLDGSRIYVTQITSNREEAFSIDGLNVTAGMTLEEAAESLATYEPVVQDSGETEYIVKNAGTTVKLTFGAAEVIAETGTQVYRLTSVTIIANAIADMML